MVFDRVSGWPRGRRLRRPAEFAVVQSADSAWRLSGSSWALVAVLSTDVGLASRQPMRVGITVARRYARRAVDRSLLKRIAREAARAASPRLDALLTARKLRIEVVMRLKAPWRTEPAASLVEARRAARADADRLFDELARRVQRVAVNPAD